MGRVLPLDALARQLAQERYAHQAVVHAHGCFDLLHPGHLRHLEAAKALGDVLVVTVTGDRYVNKGPGRPVFPAALRADSVAALGCVDYVAVSEAPTAEAAIRAIRPAIYVKGHDYSDAAHDPRHTLAAEQRAVEAGGGRLHLTAELAFSSTQLLNHFFDVYPPAAQGFLRAFRSQVSADVVLDTLRALRPIKALVIGEAILDEYVYVEGLQRSPKELLIPTRTLRTESYPGGALACANHVAGFTDHVDCVTTWSGEGLAPHVTPTLFWQGAPIVKRRYVEQAFLTKLFEVQTHPPTPVNHADVVSYVTEVAGRYDLVIATDYGHGLFTPAVIAAVVAAAPRLALTVQSNAANLGYNLVTRWPHADYVCLDEPEIRLAAQDPTSPLEGLAARLRKDLGADRVTVTQGHQGSLTVSDTGTVRVPALSREVTDRLGAGDAYLSVTALGWAAGWEPELTAFVGNSVGALAVRVVGNKTAIGPESLFPFITALLT